MLHYVKYPRYRPTWPRAVQEVKAPQISWHSTHEGGKVVTPTHQPSLPPGISWYSFLEAGSTPGTWTCQMLRKKFPVTRPRINPGTFRLVAQCLNRRPHVTLWILHFSHAFQGSNKHNLFPFVSCSKGLRLIYPLLH